ncbi:hypothetical protein [Paenibacillus amylolyticus]
MIGKLLALYYLALFIAVCFGWDADNFISAIAFITLALAFFVESEVNK